MPASASAGMASRLELLLQARQTDVALAEERVDESELESTIVCMTDLLKPEELGNVPAPMGDVVSMGSILNHQQVSAPAIVRYQSRHSLVLQYHPAPCVLESSDYSSLNNLTLAGR